MKYNELTLKSRNPHSRVGRGISAGQGKTAGRGTKGQGSRAGNTRRPGFAGGQTPLLQLIPKLRGFKALNTKAEIVYTGQLNQFKGLIDNQILADAGILSSPFGRAKLIVRGEVTTKAVVSLQGASLKAIAMIEKAGGSFTAIPRQGRPIKTNKNHSPD